jgi:hypothetical protein
MSPRPATETPAAWSAAFYSLLHPVQIAALEAFLWIEEPMSALLMHHVLGYAWEFGTVAYHVRRLAGAGVLVERYSEPRRGVSEHFYALAV